MVEGGERVDDSVKFGGGGEEKVELRIVLDLWENVLHFFPNGLGGKGLIMFVVFFFYGPLVGGDVLVRALVFFRTFSMKLLGESLSNLLLLHFLVEVLHLLIDDVLEGL